MDGSLQKNIRFFVHNLMDALPPKAYDLIFFRNAFIYCTLAKLDRVLSNLSGALEAGGTLIMGVSETAGARHADLDGKNRNDVFYFEKPVYRDGIVL
jgi:chemotaxis methyl-accepting protein methylase